MAAFLFVVLVLLHFFAPAMAVKSKAPRLSVYERLINDLLVDYNRNIIPTREDGLPMEVMVNYPLITLVDIHADTQLAEYVLNEFKIWHDDRLTWDPAQYENRTHVHMRESMIWVPTTSLYNSFDNHQILEDDARFVLVKHTGECNWNRPFSVQATCALDLRTFPYDVQDCQFMIASPFYSDTDLMFVPGTMKTIGGNAEWMPIDCKMAVRTFPSFGRQMPNLDAIVRWKRNYVYYVMVLVIPTFLISIISIFGIFTAEGSVAEKIGLGLANLLAMSVMLGIVAENLPKSNELTLLGNYLIYTLCLGATAVVVSVVVDFFVHKVTKDYTTQPPRRILYLLFCVRPRPYKSPFENGTPAAKKKLKDDVAHVANHFRQMQVTEEAKFRDQWADHEWVRVMDRVELYLIVFFQLLNGCLLLWFLSFSWSQDSQRDPFPPMNSTIAYYSGESLAFPHRLTMNGEEIPKEFIIAAGYRSVTVNETALKASRQN